MTASTAPSVTLAPTQVRQPVRTVVRGIFQWVPPTAVALPLVIAAVEDGHPGLTGAFGLGVVATASAITRVMAIPQVNALLAKVGLDAAGTTVTLDQAYGIIAELESQDPPGKHAEAGRG